MSVVLKDKEKILFEVLDARYLSRDPNNNEVVIFWDNEPIFRFARYYTSGNNTRALAVVDVKVFGGSTSLNPGECIHRINTDEYESVQIDANNIGKEYNLWP